MEKVNVTLCNECICETKFIFHEAGAEWEPKLSFMNPNSLRHLFLLHVCTWLGPFLTTLLIYLGSSWATRTSRTAWSPRKASTQFRCRTSWVTGERWSFWGTRS